MKRIILSMAAALVVSFSAFAQKENRGQAPERPTVEQRTEQMVKDLNLTDAQKAKVLALNKEYEDVCAGPGAGGPGFGGPRGGHRPAAADSTQRRPDKAGKPDRKPKADSQKADKQSRPELTDEQKAEFEAKQKEQQAKREAYDAKLKEILTEEQYKTYAEKAKPNKDGNHGNKRRSRN